MVFSSTGKMPFLPPASMAMLEMVNRSSMDREATPSPANSRDWYRAPSTPISPIRWRITSLPDTMGCSLPLRVTLMAAGTLNHRKPVAMAAAMSVEPMPVEKAPSAPYVQVWESAPTMISPGAHSPFSGSRACSTPI